MDWTNPSLQTFPWLKSSALTKPWPQSVGFHLSQMDPQVWTLFPCYGKFAKFGNQLCHQFWNSKQIYKLCWQLVNSWLIHHWQLWHVHSAYSTSHNPSGTQCALQQAVH